MLRIGYRILRFNIWLSNEVTFGAGRRSKAELYSRFKE